MPQVTWHVLRATKMQIWYTCHNIRKNKPEYGLTKCHMTYIAKPHATKFVS